MTAPIGMGLEGAALERDVRLARAGWRRRFVGGPPALTEMVELYSDLGYEVCLEPLDDEDLGDSCAGCRVALSLFRIIYTRTKP